MKMTSLYLELNKERIKNELEEIDDEVIMFIIYRFVQRIRERGTKNGL